MNTEGSILPICWSNSLPDNIVDGGEHVYVAGWGSTQDVECNTNEFGPSPFSKCKFPFDYKNMTFNHCVRSSTPTTGNALCRKLRTFQRMNNILQHNYHATHILRKSRLGYMKAVTGCYNPHPGSYGWCGTCRKTAEKPGDPGYCKVADFGEFCIIMISTTNFTVRYLSILFGTSSYSWYRIRMSLKGKQISDEVF